MVSKKIGKNIERLFSWLGLICCSLIIKVIPGNGLYSFAKALAKLGYYIARKQRKIALDSLSIAFGQDKTYQEIKGIVRDCFTFMAKSAVELLFLMERPDGLKQRVRLIGKENLNHALSKGKGVILVSGHFGNFPLMLACLGLEGYKTVAIMRPMRDSRVEKFFLAKRQQLKIRTIYSQPRNVCVRDSIRSLRDNALLFIPIDQNFGTGGIFVDFFGRKAATATGPVVLAQRSGAVILPCFIVRQKDDTHKIIFEPALNLEAAKDERDTIIINIQRLTNIIEAYIRRYPSQWGWIHRRWKTKL